MRQGVRGAVVKLSNIKTVRDRYGNTRRYLQVKGHKLVPLPDLPLDDPDFIAAWAEAKRRLTGRTAAPMAGTIAQLCDAYMRSPDFRTKSTGYQAILRRHILVIDAMAGTSVARHLQPKHLKADIARLAPADGQSRFKTWRALAKFGLDVGYLTEDPTAGLTKPKLPKSDGHPTWTAAEVEAFRTRWKIGTVQRAIFELIHWTGARISDAVMIGPGMVGRDGVLAFRQTKTGGMAYVPWTCPLPSFAAGMEADRKALHEALASCAGHMTFLATRQGRTRSSKAIGGDVSKAARLAGVSKSAHGLRKTRSVALAEGGATAHQIGAWTGHESLSEVQHYTLAMERRKAVSGAALENNPSPLENRREKA